MDHKLDCIKAESGSGTNMDGSKDHNLHCIKSYRDIDTHMDWDMDHNLHIQHIPISIFSHPMHEIQCEIASKDK
jgi:hypothetical protein